MWFLLMLIVLLTNGMSAFGLKVIAGWALPGSVKFPYLAIWYAAGLAGVGAPMLLRGMRLSRKDLLWGALMAALSIAGQVAMAVALDSNVPGHIVFPVAIGGSIFVVVLAGRIFFHERMSRLNIIGIIMGFIAVILLGMS
jgi:multidrug transporter EmrE-like cation transporter